MKYIILPKEVQKRAVTFEKMRDPGVLNEESHSSGRQGSSPSARNCEAHENGSFIRASELANELAPDRSGLTVKCFRTHRCILFSNYRRNKSVPEVVLPQ